MRKQRPVLPLLLTRVLRGRSRLAEGRNARALSRAARHRNRDGSHATQVARERILTQIANQLHDMGFRHMQAGSLKPKHVEVLVER